VPGHLAVGFNGEPTTASEKFSFSNNTPPAFDYDLIRLQLMIHLGAGRARVLITDGAATVVDTGDWTHASFGPWIRCDLPKPTSGNYDVRITTEEAEGMVYINLDEMDHNDNSNWIGFEYNCTFSDDIYNVPEDRTEVYHWQCNPANSGQPNFGYKASQLMADQSVNLTVEDDGGGPIQFMYGEEGSGPFTMRTTPELISGIAHEQTTNPEPYPLTGTALGYWKIQFDYTAQHDDAAFQLTLEQP
jgi:hypothetical protein